MDHSPRSDRYRYAYAGGYWRSGPLTTFIAAILIVAAAVAASCESTPRVEIMSPDGHTDATVRVEIADTQSSREVGLMFRSELAENAGMLFVFSQPSKLQFWMKNTEISLDMIFADSAGRVVGIVADAVPYSEKLLSVDAPAAYVLEVNGGFCARHGIKAGDTMVFTGFTPRSLD